MNATTFAEFRTAPGRDREDDAKMDQIRELLIGDLQRQNEARMDLLEARVRELEASLHHRLDAIQTRLEHLTGQTSAENRAAFDELARGIADLGDRVRRIR